MSRIAELIAVAEDIESETVHVTAWNVDIEVRGMDGHNRARFLGRFTKAKEADDDLAIGSIETDLLVFCCYDPEDKSQAFTPQDIPMLLTKSGAAIGLLSTVAMRVSGLDADAQGKASGSSSPGSQSSTPTSVSTSALPTN